MLTYHLSICTAIKYKEMVDEYEKKIKELEDRLKNCKCSYNS
jgi:hypothetical protein